MPEIVTRWFWLIFLAMTGINAAIYRHRARGDLSLHPEKSASYSRLLRGYLIWFSVPWIVAGGIILTGGADSIFDFFRPAEASLAVAGWHLLVFALWLLLAYWLFVNDGAEELASHSAFLRNRYSASAIKLWAAGGFSAGFIAEIAMWSGAVPTPNFR